MKQIFTLAIAMIAATASYEQVVINEFYPEPGSGRNEFFELYNTSTSSVNSSVDGFTLVSYFETGTDKGFYVLDLPDLNIAPRGFFVGASGSPFSFQTTNNSTNVNFSWNDPALAAKSGYLKKWVLASDNDGTDGNKDYNVASIPANFNDLFNYVSGGSAAYNVFVFKNGVLVNIFFGGLSNSTFPSFIASMPSLKIDLVTSGATTFSFTMKPNSIKTLAFESVTSSIGSDNGYTRTKDGTCSSWAKSSSGVNHTPGVSNGPSGATIGEVTIAANILQGGLAATTSKLSYNIVSASTNVFPLDIYLYTDNGNIKGELDATDTYFETNNISSLTTTVFTSNFTPEDADILMVVKTAAGCYDQVKLVQNVQAIILPLTITSFNADKKNGKVAFQWSVNENELLDKVVLEKNEGQQFLTQAIIMGTDKKGNETYTYTDAIADDRTITWRLKIFHKTGKIEYSKFISISKGQQHFLDASMMGNPVHDQFKISIASAVSAPVNIRVLDQAGKVVINKIFNCNKGVNTIELIETKELKRGFYYVEITQESFRSILKAVKL